MSSSTHKWLFAITIVAVLAVGVPAESQEKKLEPMNLAYTAVVALRTPLWVAKDNGFFEKHGLDVSMATVGGGPTAVQALLSGNIDIINAGTIAPLAAAGQGAPVVIIGALGWVSFKLITPPSITKLEQLKGKVVGISRAGALSDFTMRRMLRRIGLDPAKDVTIFPTGVGNPEQRLQLLLQGRTDADLVPPEVVVRAEIKGQKVNVLADLVDYEIYVTEDFATTRSYLKKYPQRVAAFFRAVTEASRAMKKDRELAYRALRKNMKVDDTRILQVMYESNIVKGVPDKPYPQLQSIEQSIEDHRTTVPDLKIGVKDIIDTTSLDALEKEGFFARILR